MAAVLLCLAAARNRRSRQARQAMRRWQEYARDLRGDGVCCRGRAGNDERHQARLVDGRTRPHTHPLDPGAATASHHASPSLFFLFRLLRRSPCLSSQERGVGHASACAGAACSSQRCRRASVSLSQSISVIGVEVMRGRNRHNCLASQLDAVVHGNPL